MCFIKGPNILEKHVSHGSYFGESLVRCDRWDRQPEASAPHLLPLLSGLLPLYSPLEAGKGARWPLEHTASSGIPVVQLKATGKCKMFSPEMLMLKLMTVSRQVRSWALGDRPIWLFSD